MTKIFPLISLQRSPETTQGPDPQCGRRPMRLEDAQTYASTADKAHSGEAADSFRTYFKNCVGTTCPSDRAQQDEPLVVNLVAACTQLAKACDRYADHVEAAKEKILQQQMDLFEMDMPWDQPMFGGNGYGRVGGTRKTSARFGRPAEPRNAVSASSDPRARPGAVRARVIPRTDTGSSALGQSRGSRHSRRGPHSAGAGPACSPLPNSNSSAPE
ncbi:hypothetical protein [Streptomyces sp. NPDC126933]|uniref:hypothetical protein n=1 Tax=unclassified Streptomyces TaxID=2593676 RepID=UPI0036606078